MKVRSYHEIGKDHLSSQIEFLRWCRENGIKAKWKSASRRPKHWIGYDLDNVPETQRRAHNCHHWEIENEVDAMAAKLAWSE